MSTFLSDKSVAARYQVSRATIWRWTRDNSLPSPIKLNGITRWQLRELEAWEKKKFDPN